MAIGSLRHGQKGHPDLIWDMVPHQSQKIRGSETLKCLSIPIFDLNACVLRPVRMYCECYVVGFVYLFAVIARSSGTIHALIGFTDVVIDWDLVGWNYVQVQDHAVSTIA